MFANVSCLSILIVMSSAVEILGSQHNGAGNYKEVGIVLQRSILILMITLSLCRNSEVIQPLGERRVCDARGVR
jgi:hypothetical protein